MVWEALGGGVGHERRYSFCAALDGDLLCDFEVLSALPICWSVA